MSPKILLAGPKNITEFLRIRLTLKGFDTIITKEPSVADISNLANLTAIIDLNNYTNDFENYNLFLYNTSNVRNLLDLASENNAKYILCYHHTTPDDSSSSINFAKSLIRQYGKYKNIDYTFLRIGDIYGEDLITCNKLDKFLKSLINGESLYVENDLAPVNLIHQEDFVNGLVKIINHTSDLNTNKNISLTSADPITEIELAHFLRILTDLGPSITYTLTKEPNTIRKNRFSISTVPNWKPEISLEAGLKGLFNQKDIPILSEAYRELMEEKIKISQENLANKIKQFEDPSFSKEHPVPLQQNINLEKVAEKNIPNNINRSSYSKPREVHIKAVSKNKPRVKIFIAIAILLFFMSTPSILFANNLIRGKNHLQDAVHSIESFDIASANISSNNAIKYITKIENIPFPISIIATVKGLKREDAKQLIRTAKYTAELINHLTAANLTMTHNLGNMIAGESSNILGMTTDTSAQLHLDKSLELLNVTESNLNELKTKDIPFSDLINDISEKLSSNKIKLEKLKNIEQVLPIITGQHETQRYLVLFQNSNEIRATGGFIGSYGIIEIDRGNLKLIKIDDIYNPDGQLELNNINIIPPIPIRQAFGHNQLFIRDANWNPDFPSSAKQIKRLYELATNEKIDGVIATDLIFLKNLLDATGEVDLPIYNETINTENFYAIIQYNSEKEFFPGSNQKRTFLSELTDTLIQKIIEDQTLLPTLAGKIYSSLDTKNLLIYHENDEVLSALLKNKWAGAIQNTPEDYLYVIDSNLGANKANLYVKRSIQYKGFRPQRDSGYVRQVIINYNHTGTSDIWPSGDYFNHLRVIVPQDVFLNSAHLVIEGKKINITRNVDVVPYGKKAMYETDIIVKVGQKVSVILEYESDKGMLLNDKLLNLFIQKQPGTNADPLNITFSYPFKQLDDTQVPKGATFENHELKISTNLELDRDLEIPVL